MDAQKGGVIFSLYVIMNPNLQMSDSAMFQLLQFGATHPCGKMSSKSCMVSPISILEKLLHFVIFIVISDVAGFDVCAIKDGKVIGPPQVKCRLLISSIFYVMNF